jgi:hypothetical protein
MKLAHAKMPGTWAGQGFRQRMLHPAATCRCAQVLTGEGSVRAARRRRRVTAAGAAAAAAG